MAKMKITTCPMCEREFEDYPAISRTMGREEICPDCGMKQALTQFQIASSRVVQTRMIYDWSTGDADIISFITNCLNRHMNFDWGDLDEEDKHSNDVGIINDDRLFSSYNIPPELKREEDMPDDDEIWIITEWNRQVTTILFPSDY